MKNSSLLQEILRIYNENKKFIFLLNGIVFVMVLVTLLLLPKWYVGRATIMVTGQTQSAALSSLRNILPINLLPGMEFSVDRYFVLVNSRTVLDKLIEKFDLDSLYDYDYREDLYKRLSKDIKLIENDNGSITIECLYKDDPYKAAEMANFLFEELKTLNLEISNRQGREYRIFLEKIYDETITDLERYEDSLKTFQQVNAIYDVEEQAKQLISVLGEIQTQKIQLETEKLFLEKFQNNQSSKILELNQKIATIDFQIKKIIETNQYTGIALKNLPEAGITYLRLYRNLKIKEKILEFIVPQLEQAKLEEKKNTVEIYLLDRAIPQFKKVKPQRAKLLIIYMTVSLMATFTIIKLKEIYLDFVKNHKDEK